jgi:predicted CoA-substrate-specific enzyme activase
MLEVGVLGVDVGSVSVSTALVDGSGQVRSTGYRFHKGDPRAALRALLDEAGRVPVCAVAVTTSTPAVLPMALAFDSQVSLIAAARHFVPEVRAILYVGGERFGLIRVDGGGGYLGARSNSSCAAGTGSFLDQQARRLGLASTEELARHARAARAGGGEPPRISTRCAVFARTDLVHAQQEGYALEEICDGLCRGLARNIADTLFGGEAPDPPIVMAGGVALNESVRSHLQSITGCAITAHEHSPVFAALGAALLAREQASEKAALTLGPDLLVGSDASERSYHYGELSLGSGARGSTPADNARRYVFAVGAFSARHPVEVEIFAADGAGDGTVRMGIDVGSTSTKAVLVDGSGEPRAGFYTRTLGSPLTAVQAICEAIGREEQAAGAAFRISGVASTGAGRKLIGAMVKADLVVDEITAHARAAYELDPSTDTIIEIGGQDAKFTIMRDGMVTFSHMNTVCAAGTGSFLEEQAERLGCPLSDYEAAVRGVRAPLSSDRCAVFMERDLNTFLAQGFTPGEILAAALRSVRENYLGKVARGEAIGNRIAFQGATARNRALVAAFEEGLGKKIQVSRYCHLTGALGAALLLADRGTESTTFVGLPALRAELPVRAETCTLCANHCRLRVAVIGGETVAYGFLCGRDYDAGRKVDRNRSGFDPMRERERAFVAARGERPAPIATPVGPVVGIPAALTLYGHLRLWERFFSLLGIPTVTSESLGDSAVDTGRRVQGAEFCAPVAALHGHVGHLRDRADWIFLPSAFEGASSTRAQPRVQCYYTQYSTALVARDARLRSRCLMPILRPASGAAAATRELFETIRRAGAWPVTHAAVAAAWTKASAEHDNAIASLQQRFREEIARTREPCVVLLGRAYNVLPPDMGKGIPGIFGALGVKCFTQDMIPYTPDAVSRIRGLLRSVHWENAAKILEVACVAADTPNLYPVYVTSFKCSPDSIALEYFRRILDAADKPWLVLQLDDHDSTLGYETRIEAGVASFRNHAARVRSRGLAGAPLPIIPTSLQGLDGRTLLFPCWDPVTSPLICANLRREGVDIRLLDETPLLIRRAMRHNTGQCLPLNIIVEEAIDYVRRNGLDPGRTALWMAPSQLPCNMGMFVPFMKSLLESFGDGMERMGIYPGDFFFQEFPVRAIVNAYKAYLAGGLLRRAACRLRPREKEPGATDRAVREALTILVPAFEGRRPRGAALGEAARLFDAIVVEPGSRPLAAIFGDLYVRDNDVMNQGLVGAIESAGGEAVTTPYTEYIRIVADAYFRKMTAEGKHAETLRLRALWRAANVVGADYGRPFARFLPPVVPLDRPGSSRFLEAFGMRTEHVGESFENLMKVYHLSRAYPDLALFVQASPAFCCPSLVTEAMGRDIERLTGVPVVSITYDGTGQYRNDALVPYLARGRARRADRSPTRHA